jgi:hypothetical protein
VSLPRMRRMIALRRSGDTVSMELSLPPLPCRAVMRGRRGGSDPLHARSRATALISTRVRHRLRQCAVEPRTWIRVPDASLVTVYLPRPEGRGFFPQRRR